ncbi:sulfotransferase [Formosa sp. S-31]|uniref:sulfotransferase n=1 Tax=Formosa sp. S-31 TaxID=2790949 RepID=UPI003EC037EF
MKQNNILYLLGSGRSGTTLLATILNSTNKVLTSGELHQFYTYFKNDSSCSCGDSVHKCTFWKKVIDDLNLPKDKIEICEKKQNNEEGHRYIPLILLGKKASPDYVISQKQLFNSITKHSKKQWILDSSKYIGRFLLLNQITGFNIKGIYVVRDVRGVINSFSKQVQTPRKPLNTIFYYLLTNFFGQLICWTNKNIIKVRYEDLVQNPNKTIETIYNNLLNSETENKTLNEEFKMPHIIGGNRLKTNKTIKIKKDNAWESIISRPKQILYYILCLPFMIINNYKI